MFVALFSNLFSIQEEIPHISYTSHGIIGKPYFDYYCNVMWFLTSNVENWLVLLLHEQPTTQPHSNRFPTLHIRQLFGISLSVHVSLWSLRYHHRFCDPFRIKSLSSRKIRLSHCMTLRTSAWRISVLYCHCCYQACVNVFPRTAPEPFLMCCTHFFCFEALPSASSHSLNWNYVAVSGCFSQRRLQRWWWEGRIR